MVHPNTERLTEYWRGKARGAQAPRRADIDPMEFHTLLPQAMILGRTAQGTYPFRLVGGFLADLHDRDLRGACLLDLWRPADRWQVKSAIEFARRQPEPVVISGDILADGAQPVSMEVLLVPLSGPTGEVDRILGLCQPTAPVARLRGRPARMLTVASVARSDGVEPAPGLRLAAVDGRRIA